MKSEPLGFLATLLLLGAGSLGCEKSAPPTGTSSTASATAQAFASALPPATSAPVAAPVPASPTQELVKPKAPRPKSMPEAAKGILADGKGDEVLKADAKAKPVLVEPGKEPLETLRYAFAVGAKQSVSMDMQMQIGMRMAGRDIPQASVPLLRMGLDIDVDKKLPDDKFGVLSTVSDVNVVPSTEEERVIASQMMRQIGDLKGVAIRFEVASGGAVSNVTVEGAKDGSQDLDRTLAQMTKSFESMVAPLPVEPVGIGAKWEVVTRVDSSGADLMQWASYELVKRDKSVFEVDVSVWQLAAKAAITPPNLPPKMEARLVEFASVGVGRSTIDLTSPAPIQGEMKLTTSMDIQMSTGDSPNVTGSSQTMGLDTSVSVRFAK